MSLLGSRTASGSFLLSLTLSVRRRWERRRRGRRSGAAAERRRRGSSWRGARDHRRGGFGAEAAFPSDIGKCRSERRGRQTRNTARGELAPFYTFDFTFIMIGKSSFNKNPPPIHQCLLRPTSNIYTVSWSTCSEKQTVLG